MYASLEKFCTALPAAKLDGRPTLFMNNAGDEHGVVCFA
jgi:hypothetical protein